MSLVRIITIIALLFTGMALMPEKASASSSVGFFVGYNHYYPRYYHYRPFFYRPYFYRPYYYGFYDPYYYYPRSYYRGYYLAEIRTEVKPNEARVYLDGDYVGVADDFDGWWQRLEVPPGRHRLTFRAAGYAPYVIDVRVYPGRDAHIKYQMKPGQDQIADLEMRLPRDQYDRDENDRRYRRRDSYKDRERAPYRDDRRDRDRYDNRDREFDRRDRDDDYDKYDDRSDRRERDSDRRTLSLSIDPPDSTVYIDGNYYGTANENGGPELQVLLPEGVHKVEVVRPGYASFSQEINVTRDGENRLAITLQKK